MRQMKKINVRLDLMKTETFFVGKRTRSQKPFVPASISSRRSIYVYWIFESESVGLTTAPLTTRTKKSSYFIIKAHSRGLFVADFMCLPTFYAIDKQR